MRMFDRGTGPPIVVVPGVQGRWEWMQPALVALSRSCRTISYTLCGNFRSGWRRDPEAGFDNYLRQLDDVIERTGVVCPAVCGVSYGGWIALRYAARRPDRVSALVLASAPAPGWKPSRRQARYLGAPWLSAPAFVVLAPFRSWPEIRKALPDWRDRLRFMVTHGFRVATAPMLPPLMAARVREAQDLDFLPDCRAVTAPTLILTGEPDLDTVVPVEITRRYLTLIPGSRYELMSGTGHLGLVTQSRRFAEIVSAFVHASRK